MVVFSYYVLDAVVVIYPYYNSFNSGTQVLVLLQSLFCVALMVLTLLTFKVRLIFDSIQWILYSQAILMSLSNFIMLEEDETNNFHGLHMMTTVFSVIFAIFNTLIASLIIRNQNIKLPLSVLLFIVEIVSIIQTNFVWEDMSLYTTGCIIIFIIYTVVLVLAFGFLSQGIMDE